MQEDASEQRPDIMHGVRLFVEKGEDREPDGPGDHSEDHDFLGAESNKEDGQKQKEADFGNLAERHLCRAGEDFMDQGYDELVDPKVAGFSGENGGW